MSVRKVGNNSVSGTGGVGDPAPAAITEGETPVDGHDDVPRYNSTPAPTLGVSPALTQPTFGGFSVARGAARESTAHDLKARLAQGLLLGHERPLAQPTVDAWCANFA